MILMLHVDYRQQKTDIIWLYLLSKSTTLKLRKQSWTSINIIVGFTFFSSAADELISDVLLWTPTYGRAKAGRPARTYIQQLCEDTGCNPEDLPEAMSDREKWRERVRDIRAGGTTWWWWWWWLIFGLICLFFVLSNINFRGSNNQDLFEEEQKL